MRAAVALWSVRIVLLLRRELHVGMRQTHERCQGEVWRRCSGTHLRVRSWWLRKLLPERSVQTWCRGLSAIARRAAAATTQHCWERSYGLPAALAQRATAQTSPPPPARRLAAPAAR